MMALGARPMHAATLSKKSAYNSTCFQIELDQNSREDPLESPNEET